MKIKLLLSILLYIASFSALGFPGIPTEFIVNQNGQTIKVSCDRETVPVLNTVNFEKLENFVNCNGKTAVQYCECINRKYEGNLSADEIKRLQIEMGMFGTPNQPHLQDFAKNIGVLQKSLSTYSADKSANCIDTSQGGAHQNDYNIIRNQESMILAREGHELDDEKHVPGYVQTKYIDEAIAQQELASAAVFQKQNQWKEQDFNFLIGLAAEIAKYDDKLLTRGQLYRNQERAREAMNETSTFDSQLDRGKEVLEWQNHVMKSVSEKRLWGRQPASFQNSPLLKSMAATFKSFGKDGNTGYFPPNKQQPFFEDLINLTKSLGLNKEQIEKLKKGETVDLSEVKRNYGKNREFRDHVNSLNRTMCDSMGAALLHHTETGDKHGMDELHKNIFRTQGRSLLNSYLGMDPETIEGAIQMRKFERLQEQMLSRMVTQFNHTNYVTDSDPAKKEELVQKYLADRKDQMGRLWCSSNEIQALSEKWKTEVQTNTEAMARAYAGSLTFVDQQSTLKRLNTKMGDLKKDAFHIEQTIELFKRDIDELQYENQEFAAEIRALEESEFQDPRAIRSLKGRIAQNESRMANIQKEIDAEEVKKGAVAKEMGETNKLIAALMERQEKAYDRIVQIQVSPPGVASTATNPAAPFTDAYREAHAFYGGRANFSSEQMNSQMAFNFGLTQLRANRNTEGDVAYGPADENGVGPEATTSDGAPETIKSPEVPATPSVNTEIPVVADNTVLLEEIDPTEIYTPVINGNTGEVEEKTQGEIVEEVTSIVSDTLKEVEDSVELGVTEEFKERSGGTVSATIAGVIEDMVNETTTAIDVANIDREASEAAKAFSASVRSINKKAEPVLGEMNFTEIGELSPKKSMAEIIEGKLTPKNFMDFIQPTEKPKENKKAATPEQLASEFNSESTIPTPLMPDAISPTEADSNIIKAKKLAARTREVTTQASKAVVSAQTEAVIAERLANTISSPKKDAKAKGKGVESSEVQRLREQIARERKVAANLEREISESTTAPVSSKTEVAPESIPVPVRTVTQVQPESTPAAITTGSKPDNSSTVNSGSNTRSVASFGGGGGGGATAPSTGSSNAQIDGRVDGGVIVNGEFIPNALLANSSSGSSTRNGTAIGSSDLKLTSESSYQLEPVSTDVQVGDVPTVVSQKFSQLGPEEKEQFIQQELLRLKTDKIIIEIADGTNLLVKSKIKLRTRMKVADLNSLLEDANE